MLPFAPVVHNETLSSNRNPFWFLRAHTLDPHDAVRDRCFLILLVRCLAWSSTFLLLVLVLLSRSLASLVNAHTRALLVASMTLLPLSSEAGVTITQSRRCLAAWLPRLTCGRRSHSTPVADSLLTYRSSLKKTHEVGVLSRRSTKLPSRRCLAPYCFHTPFEAGTSRIRVNPTPVAVPPCQTAPHSRARHLPCCLRSALSLGLGHCRSLHLRFFS